MSYGRRRIPITLSVAMLGCVAPGACDPQVGPAYRGEPIATVYGTAELAGAPATAKLDACVVWFDLIGDHFAVGADVRLASQLPTTFELAIATPPTGSLLNDFTYGGQFPDETRIGIGLIGALPAGVPLAEAAQRAAALVADRVVVWVERDVRPGTFSAAFLGAPLTRGFYLLEVVPSTEWVAGHPDATACDAAGRAPGECPAPAAGAEHAAWIAYHACLEDARRAAGCIGPRSAVDRLVPIGGFDAHLDLAIDGAGTPLARPNLL